MDLAPALEISGAVPAATISVRKAGPTMAWTSPRNISPWFGGRHRTPDPGFLPKVRHRNILKFTNIMASHGLDSMKATPSNIGWSSRSQAVSSACRCPCGGSSWKCLATGCGAKISSCGAGASAPWEAVRAGKGLGSWVEPRLLRGWSWTSTFSFLLGGDFEQNCWRLVLIYVDFWPTSPSQSILKASCFHRQARSNGHATSEGHRASNDAESDDARWWGEMWIYMEIYGGFLKLGYTQIIHFNRFFHHKPS